MARPERRLGEHGDASRCAWCSEADHDNYDDNIRFSEFAARDGSIYLSAYLCGSHRRLCAEYDAAEGGHLLPAAS